MASKGLLKLPPSPKRKRSSDDGKMKQQLNPSPEPSKQINKLQSPDQLNVPKVRMGDGRQSPKLPTAKTQTQRTHSTIQPSTKGVESDCLPQLRDFEEISIKHEHRGAKRAGPRGTGAVPPGGGAGDQDGQCMPPETKLTYRDIADNEDQAYLPQHLYEGKKAMAVEADMKTHTVGPVFVARIVVLILTLVATILIFVEPPAPASMSYKTGLSGQFLVAIYIGICFLGTALLMIAWGLKKHITKKGKFSNNWRLWTIVFDVACCCLCIMSMSLESHFASGNFLHYNQNRRPIVYPSIQWTVAAILIAIQLAVHGVLAALVIKGFFF